MKTRVITSIVGLAILALVLRFFDTVLFDLVIAAISLIAIHEAFSAIGFTKKEWYIYLPFVPLTLLTMLSNTSTARMLMLPGTFLCGLYLCACTVICHAEINFEKLGALVFFSGVILMSFYSLIYLKRRLPEAQFHADAIYFILLILCFAWGGDTFAYFAGRLFGKHKLAPVVSPKKTVEGAIGGILGSILLGALATIIYQMVGARTDSITVRVGANYYLALIMMGAIASVLGILGDLFASVVKRQHNIKDYGTIMPGHGGILDRFDSVMFVAPFVAMTVRFVFYLV